MTTFKQALYGLGIVWLGVVWLGACVDPHDPAKEQHTEDEGPGTAEAAAHEAEIAESMKARGPNGEIPGGELTAEQVPLPEDFEDEYAKRITDDNYEAELQALEKLVNE